MSKIIYFIFIMLMLIGNCFGTYKLFADKQSFITQFPKLTENLYFYFKLLPVINIIALLGLLFWQKWAAYVAIILGVVVIGFDIYLGIKYHLYIAVISTIVLVFLIFLILASIQIKYMKKITVLIFAIVTSISCLYINKLREIDIDV